MNEIVCVVSEPPEGGYAAEALGQPIFTVADTPDELSEMVRDAVICHFEEDQRPKITRLHFMREMPARPDCVDQVSRSRRRDKPGDLSYG